MSRGMWFVAGAGTGVWAMIKARRTAQAFTPDGISDRLAGLNLGVRLLADEVRQGAGEKESELRERLEIGARRSPALESGRHSRAIEPATTEEEH